MTITFLESGRGNKIGANHCPLLRQPHMLYVASGSGWYMSDVRLFQVHFYVLGTTKKSEIVILINKVIKALAYSTHTHSNNTN